MLIRTFTRGQIVYVPDPLHEKYFRAVKYSDELEYANSRNLVFQHPTTARIVGKQMAEILKIGKDVDDE